MFNSNQEQVDALEKRIKELEAAIKFHGELVNVSLFSGLHFAPAPQLKDRIHLIEENLGIEYEQVPAQAETWKAKKKRKARA